MTLNIDIGSFFQCYLCTLLFLPFPRNRQFYRQYSSLPLEGRRKYLPSRKRAGSYSQEKTGLPFLNEYHISQKMRIILNFTFGQYQRMKRYIKTTLIYHWQHFYRGLSFFHEQLQKTILQRKKRSGRIISDTGNTWRSALSCRSDI